MLQALRSRGGFTLTELLVVVAIIVLLTSIVVPNLAGRLTVARMHAAEDQIAEIEAALAAYHADFGAYPGDVFPTEDRNNDGVLEPNEDANGNDSLDAGEDLDGDGNLDYGEDVGVDIDGDGVYDYACDTDGTQQSNGRLDRGDGVINIDDLEWALRTTAKNGPYLDEIPLDPWGNKYVYYAPLTRPTNTADFLYIDPNDDTNPMRSEDTNENGRLDGDTKPRNGIPADPTSTAHEDRGIGKYATTASNVNTTTFGSSCAGADCLWAGQDNGILDHGDDDNKNGTVETYITASPRPSRDEDYYIELGNYDISPDGLARDLGYYLYSVGRNKIDETATGYEDINLDYQPNTVADGDELSMDDSPNTFDEDLDLDTTLDTGYEDTGLDGRPHSKDRGEADSELTITSPDPTGQPDEEFGTQSGGPTTWHYNTHHTPGDLTGEGFDIGGDDINSWNKKAPWRDHTSYGG